MDPEQALKDAAAHAAAGETAEAMTALTSYWSWRRSHGFEPRDGDARARRIEADLEAMSGRKDDLGLTVRVYLLAFYESADVRRVSIPDLAADAPLAAVLEATFHHGQNDFHPQAKPSVSVGDVVEYGGQHYLVCGCGFRKLADAEFAAYKAMPRGQRPLCALQQAANI